MLYKGPTETKDKCKITLIKKGKYTVKYLFNKNNFINYTALNKKYKLLFPLCKTAYSTTCKQGSAFYKHGHAARCELITVLNE